MDFEKVIKGVMGYSTYVIMRNQGSSPDELTYFHDHVEMERQYQDGLKPEQLGRAIIDAETSKVLGEMQ
jgi:hypothetical protein